jgi:hypothetical protein
MCVKNLIVEVLYKLKTLKNIKLLYIFCAFSLVSFLCFPFQSSAASTGSTIMTEVRKSTTSINSTISFTMNVPADKVPKESAVLTIKANDVDEEQGEHDFVKVNGTQVGRLSGENNKDSTTSFVIDPTLIKAGANVINITVTHFGQSNSGRWILNIHWGQLLLDGGAAEKADFTNLKIEHYDISAGTVSVNVTSEVTAKQNGNYTIEANLIDPNGNNVGLQKVSFPLLQGQTKVYQPVFTYPLSSGSGTYTVNAFLFDNSTGQQQSAQFIKFDHIVNNGPAIDQTPPTILSVTSSKPDGTYGKDESIIIEVKFDEPVYVSGNTKPRLLLETGIVDQYANYFIGTGTDTLKFEYIVQEKDLSQDLEYMNTNALELNGGTIADSSNNNAVLTLPTIGSGHSLSDNKNLKIFTNTAPTISSDIHVDLDEDTSFLLDFQVDDEQSLATDLILTVSSDNEELLPTNQQIIIGTDKNRSLSINPRANQSGVGNIIISVSDGLLTTSQTIAVNVRPVNDLPSIQLDNDADILINGQGVIQISGTASDIEEGALTVSSVIGGVKKQSNVVNGKWTLTWNGVELPDGTYSDVDLRVEDEQQGWKEVKYAGVITVDKILPTATVSYSKDGPTNENIVATIHPSEAVTITNNDGLASRTFEENGSYTFEFVDAAGNKGSVTAIVANIDKVVPTATIEYSKVGPTNGNVVVTITPSEEVTITNNDGLASRMFEENGSYTFEFVDAAGNKGSVTAVVGNIDKIAPILKVTLDKNIIWPPNHKMVDIKVTLEYLDDASGISSVVLTSITSNEPDYDSTKGEGDVPNDIQNAEFGTADTSFSLRAERSSKGTGRIYTIVYTVTDKAGNSTSVVVTVTVPHDQSSKNE